jgi:ATP-dependent Clp protease protease subunit
MHRDRKHSHSGLGDEIWVMKFDEESAQVFRENLMDSSKMDPTRPIVVYIDSYGGQVDSLAKMIESMDEIPNPIITVAMGKAMSCGAILLSHGDYRLCGVHSRVMIHEVSGATSGDIHDMHADTVEHKRLNKYFMGLMAKNCGISGGYEELRKLIKARDGRDLYLDAHDAVKFGIVDAVGLPKIDSMLLHNVSLAPAKKIVQEKAATVRKNNKKSESIKPKKGAKGGKSVKA